MTAFYIKDNAKQLSHFILIFSALILCKNVVLKLLTCFEIFLWDSYWMHSQLGIFLYFIGFRTYSYNNLDRGNIWMYDEEICEVWFSFTLDSYYQQNSISDKGTWLMDDMIEAHVWEWGQWLWRFFDSTISYFIISA